MQSQHRDSKTAHQLQVLACHWLLLQEAVNDIHGQEQRFWHELHSHEEKLSDLKSQ